MLTTFKLHEILIEFGFDCFNRIAYVDWIDIYSFNKRQLAAFILSNINCHKIDAKVHRSQVI
jgi:hypothetical protein